MMIYFDHLVVNFVILISECGFNSIFSFLFTGFPTRFVSGALYFLAITFENGKFNLYMFIFYLGNTQLTTL